MLILISSIFRSLQIKLIVLRINGPRPFSHFPAKQAEPLISNRLKASPKGIPGKQSLPVGVRALGRLWAQ
jgi:hypothetical protein